MINDTGKYTPVNGFVMDYDEPTNKFIISITIPEGVLQLKLSEADSLSVAKMIIECIWRSKGMYQADDLR